jgi:hypothetical protein
MVYFIHNETIKDVLEAANYIKFWFIKAVNSPRPINLSLPSLYACEYHMDTIYEGIDFLSSMKILQYSLRYLEEVDENSNVDNIHLFLRLVFANDSFQLALGKLVEIAILHCDIEEVVGYIHEIALYEMEFMVIHPHTAGISETVFTSQYYCGINTKSKGSRLRNSLSCYRTHHWKNPFMNSLRCGTRDSCLTGYDFLKSMISILHRQSHQREEEGS